MFRQGRLPKLILICIKANFARRSSSPRCGPRPDLADQPTATKPRPKWKRPARRPARHAVLKSATTKINYKKWETATSWDCHSASADPFRRGPPRSSVTAAKPIPTDRFDAERLAARVDRSSGADFSWCWPSRRPCWLCCSQFASSDRCQLDPCRSQRSNDGVADRCELGRLYQGRCWWPDESDAALCAAVDIPE